MNIETDLAKFVSDFVGNKDEKFSGLRVIFGLQLINAGQSMCYITQAADIMSKLLSLPRDKVSNLIQKDEKLYFSILSLKAEIADAVINIKNKKGGIYDICALVTGSVTVDKTEKINEEGAKISTTTTRKMNPQIARDFLKHATMPETGIDVSQSDLSEEDVIPIIREEKKEVRLMSLAERKRIESRFDAQQKRALSTLLDRNSRIVSLGGAIRCGKTYLACYASIRYIEWHYSTSIEDMKAQYNDTHHEREKGQIAFIGRSAPAVFQNVFAGVLSTFKIKGKMPAARSFMWSILNYSIKISGYGTVAVEGLKGMTADHIHIDEADNCTEKNFLEIIGRISNPWAKIFVVWNPKYPAHWLSKRVESKEIAEGLSTTHFNFSLLECEFADKEFIKMLTNNYGIDHPLYKRFVIGIPASAAGSVYSMFDESKQSFHVEEDEKYINKYDSVVIGMDEGIRSPRVYLAIGIWKDGATTKCDVISELYYPVGHNDYMTFKGYNNDLSNFIKPIGDKLDAIYVPHDAGRAKKELELTGYNIKNCTRKMGVMSGIGIVQSMFTSGRLRISSGCKNLIRELYLYQFKEESENDEIDKRYDHACDALRYAITSCGAFSETGMTVNERISNVFDEE